MRLSHTGLSLEQLAVHCRRSVETIRRNLKRYQQHGLKGLADGQAPGKPAKITPAMVSFVHQKLAEQRVWNCELLSEAIRVKLHELDSSWKRGRYSPARTPDPTAVTESDASIKTLKKGLWTAN